MAKRKASKAKRKTTSKKAPKRKKPPARKSSAAVDKARARGKYRREKSSQYSRSDSASVREIGEIPKCRQPRRRAAAMRSTERFALTYFPERFPLKFSSDHKKALKRCDDAIDQNDLFAWSMPRGSGKTSIAEVAAIKAILSGKHPFVALIGSDKESAVDMLESIKIELETNEKLGEDFPEVCFPIAALEGINHRCSGQLAGGERTRIEWGAERIVLPTIAGSASSGAVVRAYGITGRIRGAKYRRPNGDTVRPSFVVVDDPQTDESAWSNAQCAARERVLKGAILGLAGPGKKVAGIVPITVIREDDLADRLLDRATNPEFHGERFSMLDGFPTNLELWEQYNERRVSGLESGEGLGPATAFYRKHRKKLDAGVRANWLERFDRTSGEISAVQHAMNLYFLDAWAFFCEYQNKPPKADDGGEGFLSAAAIARQANDLDRGIVPAEASKVCAFVDVQGSMLWYAVLAFSGDFRGWILDYGSWPRQARRYYTLQNATSTFANSCKATSLEGRIVESLKALVENDLAVRDYKRTDGANLRLGLCLIDAQWGASTESVYSFIRGAAFPNVYPSHGVYIGASGSPISDDVARKGDVIGLNWKIPGGKQRQGVRRVIYDANYWKTFASRRIATPLGDPGSLSLYSAPPAAHRMIADHFTAETAIETSGRGRTCLEWRLRPNKPDNHLFDCVAGACCAGSVSGARLPGASPPASRRRGKRRATYF